jgi:hypothetical protein
MHSRHVNEETAGKRDVTRDARALFPERFFGDLDDDILTGLEHFGNELRTARRAGALEAIAATMMSATWAAALEASAWTATAMIAAATAVATTITSAITATIVASATIASTATIGALEA